MIFRGVIGARTLKVIHLSPSVGGCLATGLHHICNIDKNLLWPKRYLCVKFGCSAPDCVGGVCGPTNKQTDKQTFGPLGCTWRKLR